MRIEFPTEQVAKEVAAEKSSAFITNLLSYKQTVMYFCIGITILSLAVTFWLSKGDKRSKKFINIEETLVAMGDNIAVNKETAQSLEKTLKAYPELAGRIGDVLAQHFLTMREVEAAGKHAKAAFERTAFAESHYTDFARNSLLIEQKQYNEALAASNSLKDRMLSDQASMSHDFGGMLFGFNLIRIVFLHQMLGSHNMELKGIDEVKSFLGWELKEGQKAVLSDKIGKALLKHFSDQNVSMIDYFNQRELELNS
jgi:hypothetical protein